MMEGGIVRHVGKLTCPLVIFEFAFLFVYGIGPIILTVRMIWQAVRMIILKRAIILDSLTSLQHRPAYAGTHRFMSSS